MSSYNGHTVDIWTYSGLVVMAGCVRLSVAINVV